jgi:hypothetical protein
MPNLPFVHELFQGVSRLGERCSRISPVDLVEVDEVHSEIPEALSTPSRSHVTLASRTSVFPCIRDPPLVAIMILPGWALSSCLSASPRTRSDLAESMGLRCIEHRDAKLERLAYRSLCFS